MNPSKTEWTASNLKYCSIELLDFQLSSLKDIDTAFKNPIGLEITLSFIPECGESLYFPGLFEDILFDGVPGCSWRWHGHLLTR